MREAKLKTAVSEAKRFIKKSQDLTDVDMQALRVGYGTRGTGALKRASMDLTRALADLRKSHD